MGKIKSHLRYLGQGVGEGISLSDVTISPRMLGTILNPLERHINTLLQDWNHLCFTELRASLDALESWL